MWLKWKKRLIARSATILYVKCPQIWLIETFCQKCQQSRKIITKCQDILEIPIVLRLNIIFDYKQVHRLFYLFFRWVSGEILKLILLLSVQILLHRIYNNSNIRVWDILNLSTLFLQISLQILHWSLLSPAYSYYVPVPTHTW